MYAITTQNQFVDVRRELLSNNKVVGFTTSRNHIHVRCKGSDTKTAERLAQSINDRYPELKARVKKNVFGEVNSNTFLIRMVTVKEQVDAQKQIEAYRETTQMFKSGKKNSSQKRSKISDSPLLV